MKNILDSVTDLPCHPQNRGGTRSTSAIRYLVYHYTGNDADRAESNARYYRDNVVGASAHYFVDDEHIYRSVEDTGTAWAVGGKKWADCRQTGGGTLYGVCTNSNSLSIEMCDTRRDGAIMATEATLERAAELGRALVEKYGIPMERVVRHFDVTGKHCPAYFMDAAAWEKFKTRLAGPEKKKEDGNMKVYRYVAEMPEWARASATKAIEMGVIKMDAAGAVSVWECNLQPLVWMDRLGVLDKRAGFEPAPTERIRAAGGS